MYLINLIPKEEIENRKWFLPDLFVIFLFYFLSNYIYEQDLRNKIDFVTEVKNSTAQIKKRIKKLDSSVSSFNEINNQVEKIKQKTKSLENITSSSVERFKSLIVLEILQNLKPENLWFTYLENNTNNSSILLSGGSFTNGKIGEFMTSLGSLKDQAILTDDIKTVIYFDKIYLNQITTDDYLPSNRKEPDNINEADENFQEILNDENKFDNSQESVPQINTDDSFKGFPFFSLQLQYAEKKDKNAQ
ncbi:MAG: hypothetical protein CMP11_06825 [Zetaproteobacteria bacterium]|nr:hypothetical protein [Pseudobdellovibrionaceae bacterium]